jgi:hypothetical protein
MLLRMSGIKRQLRLMSPRGMANPRELNLLSQTLEQFCQEFGIERGTPEHEDAGRRLMALFVSGVSTPADLERLLRARPH